MGFDIDEALKYVVDREGSDLHVKVESPPVARVHGDLWALKGSEPLTPGETEKALHTIAEDHHLKEFEEAGEVDLSRSPRSARCSLSVRARPGHDLQRRRRVYRIQVVALRRVISPRPRS